MAEKKTEEPKEKFIVTEIPDTMKPAVVDNEAKEVYTDKNVLAKILNNQEKIIKAIDKLLS